MSSRPVIFISAVSKELRTARDLVAKTLVAVGYEPRWQDIAPTEGGDLREILRKWVDESDAVLQLVGHCYGFAPAEPDPEFGTCSYTQYEALYARQRKKPVYYVFIDNPHPTDGCGCEPPALHDLQEQYREQVRTYGELYHASSSLMQTELLVRRLKDDLAHLRKWSILYAMLVLALLALCVALVLWLAHRQGKDQKDLKDGVAEIKSQGKDAQVSLAVVQSQNEKLLQAVRDLPQILGQQPRGDAREDEATRITRAYSVLEAQLKIAPGSLVRELPQFASQLLQRADTSALDRASALYATNKFAEAETEALKAKDRALAVPSQPLSDAIAALRLAGQSARAQIHYPQAMEHYRAAAALTSKDRDFIEWLRIQNAIGWLYGLQGRYPEGLAHCQQVWQTAQQAGKDEDPEVLLAHMHYASALDTNGKSAEAEQEYRAVLKVQERVLGAEHPAALKTRMNLAVAMDDQGKSAEAEQEYRAILKVQEGVLGAEHPDTLAGRNNLAAVLEDQGKHAEAEQEYRAVLKVQERVLGAEHPDVARSCYNLALSLKGQEKLPEALAFMQRAEQVRTKVLGSDHPGTKLAKTARERLEAELKAK